MGILGFSLIVLSAATHLVEGVLIKEYNKRHEKGGFVFTSLVSFAAMLFFLFYDIIADESGLSFSPQMIPYAFIAGILYCAASLFTYLAIRMGSFALSMLILSYSLVFPTLYGVIFCGDKTTVFSYLGFAAIAVSLFLVRGDSKKEESKFSLKWLVMISLSTIGSGFFSVITRMQQIKFNNAQTNEFMVLALLISALTLFTVGVVMDKRDTLTILKKGTPYAICAGVSNGATNLLSLITNLFVLISISSPTRSAIKTAMSFILSVFVYKEKLMPRQIMGVAVGIVAVVFLNIQ